MLKDFFVGLCGTTARGGTEIDMVSFWTLCLVIVTLLLCIVAKIQLTGISNTTRAEFIKKFNSEFFLEPTRNIIMLLDYNALSYKEKRISFEGNTPNKRFPYFYINMDILNQLEIDKETKTSLENKGVYTAFEIDDLLLGRLEDIGMFEKQGFLNINDVRNHFAWYIDIAWGSKDIQKYIASQRSLYGKSVYDKFKYIHEKVSM